MTHRLQPYFLTLQLDKNTKEKPLYLQLRRKIQELIDQGKLSPGDPLPSTRTLSEGLKVSRSTIIRAYKQLYEEDFIDSSKGSGSFLSFSLPRRNVQKWELGKIKRSVVEESITRESHFLLQSLQFRVQEPEPFALIAPDRDSLPGKKWTQIVSRISKMPWLHNGYCKPGGFMPFKKVLSNYLRIVRGISCEADQVIITDGIQEGLNLCTQVLFNSGDEVIVEDPSFQLHLNLIEFRGMKPVPIAVTKEGLILGKIRVTEKTRGLLVTPTHQYPLGYLQSLASRKAMLEWCREKGLWVIEDDYDSELRYGGDPYPALAALDQNQSTIYLGSFTKVIYPGFNMGYAVVPERLIKFFEGAKNLNNRHASEVHQAILAKFIEEGGYDSHVRRLKRMYELRRRCAVRAIGKYLHEFGKLEPDNQGTHLTFIFNRPINDALLSSFLKDSYHIETRPLSVCYREASPLQGLILGFAHFREEEIEKAIQSLKKGIEQFVKANG